MRYVCPVPDMSSRIRKWPWISKRGYDESRKIFRHSLVTAIILEEPRRRQILRAVHDAMDSGDIETLMIDSGGFQVWRHQLYTAEEMYVLNTEIYKKYDWATYYVLPDVPPILKEPLSESKKKIESSIQSSYSLFDRLPEKIQRKCVPVFHTRDKEDIERQADAYKHIIDASGMCCWAALRTTTKSLQRLSLNNVELLTAVKEKLPDVNIHVLGIGSRQAMYCLQNMGIFSCDSTAPTKTAFGHEVIFGFEDIHSDDTEAIKKAKEISGHECTSCANPKQLKDNWVHRCVHNLIAMEDLPELFDNTTPDQFVKMFPDWSDRVKAKGSQLAFF